MKWFFCLSLVLYFWGADDLWSLRALPETVHLFWLIILVWFAAFFVVVFLSWLCGQFEKINKKIDRK